MVFFLKISVNFLSVSPEKRQLETPETARTAGGCGCLDAQKRQGFLLLFVVASSISLISAPKGENSLIPLLLLSPPNPLALGFGGVPIWSSAESSKSAQIRSKFPMWGRGFPCAATGHTASHSGVHKAPWACCSWSFCTRIRSVSRPSSTSFCW